MKFVLARNITFLVITSVVIELHLFECFGIFIEFYISVKSVILPGFKKILVFFFPFSHHCTSLTCIQAVNS